MPSEDSAANPRLERFSYDDAIVRMFVTATLIWGLVGFLAGMVLAMQLPFPTLNGGIEWITFGRLRPLHTNAVIFAFAGNGDLRGHLLQHPAALQGAHVQRHAQPAALLGLAG